MGQGKESRTRSKPVQAKKSLKRDGELEQELAAFLKGSRGDASLALFSKQLGIRPGTLHRYERAEQSMSLHTLQLIMSQLEVSLTTIFGKKCQLVPKKPKS